MVASSCGCVPAGIRSRHTPAGNRPTGPTGNGCGESRTGYARHGNGGSGGRTVRLSPGMTAVVTGGGSGLGYAVAEALARRGCSLALVDVREDRLAEARARLAAVGPAVSVHPADVSNEAAVAGAAE